MSGFHLNGKHLIILNSCGAIMLKHQIICFLLLMKWQNGHCCHSADLWLQMEWMNRTPSKTKSIWWNLKWSSFWLKKLVIKTVECSKVFKTIFEIIKSSSCSLHPQTHHYYLGTILTIPNYFLTIIPSCFACEHWFFLFDPGMFMLNWLSSLKCETSLTRDCWRKIQNALRYSSTLVTKK